jgi:Ca2+-binding EF-hand superfamily protein
MFDFDHSGTIDFDEFWYLLLLTPMPPIPLLTSRSSLWGFLTSWRHLFDRFDVDRSGTISLDEFTAALTAFGYRLSLQYVRQLFDAYDLKGRGVLSFDLFVQSCISLKRMTDVFRRYDDDHDGFITLSL